MKQMNKVIAWILVLTMIFSVIPSNMVYAATTKMSKCKITLSKSTYNYTGSACKPSVTVKYKGKKLEKGKDFTISYTDNVNTGTATVVVKGKGKYAGTVKKKFKIKNVLSVKLSKNKFTYTGEKIKPAFTVKDGLKKLTGKEYTVTYKNNQNVGTAELIVKGKGKYKNKNSYMTFQILAASLNNATVVLSQDDFEYTGKACMPTVTVKNTDKTLVNGTDYTVVYSDNIDVGTATVSVTGKGNYTGTVKKTFTISIKTQEIQDSWISLSGTSFAYTREEIKPTVTVQDGTTTLTEGTDYIVTYSDNIDVGTATVSVTGKGNYTGTVKKTFTISIKTQEIQDSWISLSGTSFAYTGEEIKPTVTVKNADVTLVNGTDYIVTYSNNINAGTATVSVTGKGKYSGTVKKTFLINESKPEPEPDEPTINPTSMELKPGDKKKIEVGNVPDGVTPTFESLNTAIATVDRGGEVCGNDTPGTTDIIVTVGEYELKCSVTLIKEETDDPNPGENVYALEVEIPDFNVGGYAVARLGTHLKSSEKEIVWESSDSKIGYIIEGKTANEKYIAFLSAGEVVISATDGEITEKSTIKVKGLGEKRILVKEGTGGYETNLSDSGTGFSYGQAASSVIGQPELEKANGTEYNAPNGMAYCEIDGQIIFFVADVYNNRVLCYKGESVEKALKSTPFMVLGQADLNSNKAGYGLNEMNWPMSVACDTWKETDTETGTVNTKHRLYVADTNNNRILVFNDIESLTSGSSADYMFHYFTDGVEMSWPWSIETAKVNGVDKLIVTSTEGGKVAVYDVPVDKKWEKGVKDEADVILDFGMQCTPRAITWTGTQLLIGDENVKLEDGSSRSGFWVFNEFPTESQSVDYSTKNCFTFIPEIGYGEGAIIGDNLYLMYASGWNIFKKSESGLFIEGADDKPDHVAVSARGAGDPAYGEEGYFLNGGGTQKALSYDGKLYLSLLGRDAIVGWSEPEKLMESNRTLAPDCFFGNENYIEKVNEGASDYALRNPIVNSDGQHLIVTDDLDCKLFVYKDIPTSSGAKADYIYDLEISPNDACIYTDKSGKTTMFVVGTAHNFVYVWEDYKFDGSLPTSIISLKIGDMSFVNTDRTMTSVEYDGTYFYLSVSESGKTNAYIYRGIPDIDDNYIAKVVVDAANTFGCVKSNGEYFSISDNSLQADGSSGALVFKTSQLADATSQNPVELKEGNAYGVINKVNCGEATENDKYLCKEWIDENGQTHTNYEYTNFCFASDCMILKNGHVALADTGNNRVIVWDSVDDAIHNTTNVNILGHGINSMDSEKLFDLSDSDTHKPIAAFTADTFNRPRSLAFSGNSLWVGEFKFGYRLLRFEMK